MYLTLQRTRYLAIIWCLFSNAVRRPERYQIPGRHATATASSPRLDLNQLETNVSHYLGQALAPTTLQSYQSSQRRFTQFCDQAGLHPLPLSEKMLSLFVSHLAADWLAHQTIKCYLSAVRFFHISAGHANLFSPGAFPRLQYVLGDIKRAPRHHRSPACLLHQPC